ncbi:MAG: hypothetical protein HUU41_19840 [Bryobacteraceae bacterium]|nr:hypothetical protein [Bryobacteraceae bacterium]
MTTMASVYWLAIISAALQCHKPPTALNEGTVEAYLITAKTMQERLPGFFRPKGSAGGEPARLFKLELQGPGPQQEQVALSVVRANGFVNVEDFWSIHSVIFGAFQAVRAARKSVPQDMTTLTVEELIAKNRISGQDAEAFRRAQQQAAVVRAQVQSGGIKIDPDTIAVVQKRFTDLEVLYSSMFPVEVPTFMKEVPRNPPVSGTVKRPAQTP